MKTTKSIIIVLFVLLAAQIASAFYCPSTGRWLSRDPLGEPGFEVLRTANTLPQLGSAMPAPSRWIKRDSDNKNDAGDLYIFVGNRPINHIDPLGLLKFEGCSEDQQKQIQQQLADYVKKLDGQKFKDCMCKKPGIPDGLKKLSSNPELTVKCEAAKTGSCSDACAWSLPYNKTIHICPQGWDAGRCGSIGCTLLHEMTHEIGHPFEKWPKQVEKCLGCL